MELYISKNQYGYYTKGKNGEDILYYQLHFYKCEEPKFEKGKIKIYNAFLSNYRKKNGEKMPKIVVLSYEQVKEEKTNQTEQNDEYDESSLPF